MPVIKKYLKREDAPKILAKRSIAVLNKRCLESVELENPAPPQPIASFINSFSDKMNATKRKIENGEVQFKDLVAELPDQKAKRLKLFTNFSTTVVLEHTQKTI